METDIEELAKINVRIGLAESEGQSDYIKGILAPDFAMRRAGGLTLGRDEFLKTIEKSSPRHTKVSSVSLLGSHRAAVSCIVTMEGVEYDNFRLFVRETAGQPWRLLAWANEPLHGGGSS